MNTQYHLNNIHDTIKIENNTNPVHWKNDF
jgi:hypothetical protein